MWVFLNNAFVSAVEDMNDDLSVMVRARVEGDLERFFVNMPKVHAQIVRTEKADYLYRVTVPKKLFADTVQWHAHRITYRNFKNSIAYEDVERHDAYLDVWTVMNRLQGVMQWVKKLGGRKGTASRSVSA